MFLEKLYRKIVQLCAKNLKAFSLVEMLMALLVASLLMVAMAPVITKKFNETFSIMGVGGAFIPKTFCAYVNNGSGLLIKDTDAEGCIVPDNTYTGSAIIVSGGGGGGGAADKITGSSFSRSVNGGINADSTTVYSRREEVVTRYTNSIELELLGGGGGGGGSSSNEGGFPAQQSDCEDFGVYVKPEYNASDTSSIYYHGTCVSKRNPEVDGGGAAPKLNVSGVTPRTIGGSCSNGYCCWYGTTAGACSNDGTYGDYSGCSRSVCGQFAAKIVCDNWKPVDTAPATGRLPSMYEFMSWAPYIQYNNLIAGSAGPLNKYNSSSFPGLQLCDSSATSGATQCAVRSSGCQDSGATVRNSCRPFVLRSANSIICGGSTVDTGDCFSQLNVDNGTITAGPTYGSHFSYAFSVRCVLDRITPYISYTGAGGGAGINAKISLPDEVVKEATSGGNALLVLKAGHGGKGTSASSSGATAVAGGPSRAELYDYNNALVWAFEVPGGNPAKGASKTSNGTVGAVIDKTANKCKYLNKYDTSYSTEKTVSCSSFATINGGSAGINTDGGKGYWNGAQGSSAPGGSGSTSANLTGSHGNNGGGGGGGGTCIEGPTRLASICGGGGSGGAGAIEYKYKLGYPGVAGGGGGAGTLLYIHSFQVRPKDLIKVQVGNGGAGGSIATDGDPGGDSYIEVTRGGNSVSKYVVKGGGGGGGGTPGDTSSTPTVLPVAGAGGAASGIEASTKSKLKKEDIYLPKESDKTKGSPGVESPDVTTSTISVGGNGGINPAISPLVITNGTINGIPCGGRSTEKITVDDTTEWDCANTSNVPFSLSRELFDSSFSGSTLLDYIKNYAPGATGGGGGGWEYDASPAEAARGAKGMGGYVLIWFGDWEPAP